MKYYLIIIGIILCSGIWLSRCANPMAPTGGPKDTIPPTLIISEPPDQKINFEGRELTLEFDEFVNADKLKQQLIITPLTDIKYKYFVKKRSLSITFDEEFQDSTTYTFNFFDAVTDITEKNPPENLIIAFSTGPFIDSLTVYGSVRNLFTNAPEQKMTVALFRFTDSLDIFKSKPTYFTTTDNQGQFLIRNIKNDRYRLLAFNDENRNLIFDAATEAYAFQDSVIDPINIQDSIFLHSIKIDASPLKLISSRPNGHYFESKYSKEITKYKIHYHDSVFNLYSNISDKTNLRYYNPYNYIPSDSAQVIVEVSDSLDNFLLDTVYVMFRESNRKRAEFTYTLQPPPGSPFTDGDPIIFQFNKPIKFDSLQFLQIPVDTTISIPIAVTDKKWNHNRTRLSVTTNFSQNSLQATIDQLLSQITVDTFYVDSTYYLDSTALYHFKSLSNFNHTKFLFTVEAATFISIDGDTSDFIRQNYIAPNPESFGIINTYITTNYDSYFVQLMKSNIVVQEKYACNPCKFIEVPPGSYSFRLLIDNNSDGYWSIGNIRNLQEPESTYHYPEQTEIRPNWEIDINIAVDSLVYN